MLPIEARPHLHRLPNDAKIGHGVDSVVYRTGDSVIKKYHTLDMATVLKYQQFTNYAAASLEASPLIKNVEFEGESWRVRFSVVPVSKVSGRFLHTEAKSEFIPGPSLESMLYLYRDEVSRGLDEIEEGEERTFLAVTSEKLGSYDYAVYINNFASIMGLSELEERVTRETGVEDLHSRNNGRLELVPGNVKLRATPSLREFHLIVTDLGTQISQLKFRE